MKWILSLLYSIVKGIKIAETDKALSEARALSKEYRNAIDKADTVYTTIRSFRDDPSSYWQWAKSLRDSDQFKFMIFQLRENVIREMVGCYDKDKLLVHVGRMEMLNVLTTYLSAGVNEYETSVSRTKEDSQRASVPGDGE
jgi:hypothetical protein